MAQIDFNAWCNGKQTHHWREAFYRYLMAREIEIDSEEMLE